MNTRRLFVASCLALLTTSMVFSIRGDIVDALTLDFHITKEQMGAILSPAFWGFTLSIIIGGSLVDWLGMRNLLLTGAPQHERTPSKIALDRRSNRAEPLGRPLLVRPCRARLMSTYPSGSNRLTT